MTGSNNFNRFFRTKKSSERGNTKQKLQASILFYILLTVTTFYICDMSSRFMVVLKLCGNFFKNIALDYLSYQNPVTMGTGSFPGVKWPGRGADHPPPSKRRGHERVEQYLYSPPGTQWPVIGRTFTFTKILFSNTK